MTSLVDRLEFENAGGLMDFISSINENYKLVMSEIAKDKKEKDDKKEQEEIKDLIDANLIFMTDEQAREDLKVWNQRKVQMQDLELMLKKILGDDISKITAYEDGIKNLFGIEDNGFNREKFLQNDYEQYHRNILVALSKAEKDNIKGGAKSWENEYTKALDKADTKFDYKAIGCSQSSSSAKNVEVSNRTSFGFKVIGYSSNNWSYIDEKCLFLSYLMYGILGEDYINSYGNCGDLEKRVRSGAKKYSKEITGLKSFFSEDEHCKLGFLAFCRQYARFLNEKTTREQLGESPTPDDDIIREIIVISNWARENEPEYYNAIMYELSKINSLKVRKILNVFVPYETVDCEKIFGNVPAKKIKTVEDMLDETKKTNAFVKRVNDIVKNADSKFKNFVNDGQLFRIEVSNYNNFHDAEVSHDAMINLTDPRLILQNEISKRAILCDAGVAYKIKNIPSIPTKFSDCEKAVAMKNAWPTNASDSNLSSHIAQINGFNLAESVQIRTFLDETPREEFVAKSVSQEKIVAAGHGFTGISPTEVYVLDEAVEDFGLLAYNQQLNKFLTDKNAVKSQIQTGRNLTENAQIEITGLVAEHEALEHVAGVNFEVKAQVNKSGQIIENAKNIFEKLKPDQTFRMDINIVDENNDESVWERHLIAGGLTDDSKQKLKEQERQNLKNQGSLCDKLEEFKNVLENAAKNKSEMPYIDFNIIYSGSDRAIKNKIKDIQKVVVEYQNKLAQKRREQPNKDENVKVAEAFIKSAGLNQKIENMACGKNKKDVRIEIAREAEREAQMEVASEVEQEAEVDQEASKEFDSSEIVPYYYFEKKVLNSTYWKLIQFNAVKSAQEKNLPIKVQKWIASKNFLDEYYRICLSNYNLKDSPKAAHRTTLDILMKNVDLYAGGITKETHPDMSYTYDIKSGCRVMFKNYCVQLDADKSKNPFIVDENCFDYKTVEKPLGDVNQFGDIFKFDNGGKDKLQNLADACDDVLSCNGDLFGIFLSLLDHLKSEGKMDGYKTYLSSLNCFAVSIKNKLAVALFDILTKYGLDRFCKCVDNLKLLSGEKNTRRIEIFINCFLDQYATQDDIDKLSKKRFYDGNNEAINRLGNFKKARCMPVNFYKDNNDNRDYKTAITRMGSFSDREAEIFDVLVSNDVNANRLSFDRVVDAFYSFKQKLNDMGFNLENVDPNCDLLKAYKESGLQNIFVFMNMFVQILERQYERNMKRYVDKAKCEKLRRDQFDCLWQLKDLKPAYYIMCTAKEIDKNSNDLTQRICGYPIITPQMHIGEPVFLYHQIDKCFPVMYRSGSSGTGIYVEREYVGKETEDYVPREQKSSDQRETNNFDRTTDTKGDKADFDKEEIYSRQFTYVDLVNKILFAGEKDNYVYSLVSNSRFYFYDGAIEEPKSKGEIRKELGVEKYISEEDVKTKVENYRQKENKEVNGKFKKQSLINKEMLAASLARLCDTAEKSRLAEKFVDILFKKYNDKERPIYSAQLIKYLRAFALVFMFNDVSEDDLKFFNDKFMKEVGSDESPEISIEISLEKRHNNISCSSELKSFLSFRQMCNYITLTNKIFRALYCRCDDNIDCRSDLIKYMIVDKQEWAQGLLELLGNKNFDDKFTDAVAKIMSKVKYVPYGKYTSVDGFLANAEKLESYLYRLLNVVDNPSEGIDDLLSKLETALQDKSKQDKIYELFAALTKIDYEKAREKKLPLPKLNDIAEMIDSISHDSNIKDVLKQNAEYKNLLEKGYMIKEQQRSLNVEIGQEKINKILLKHCKKDGDNSEETIYNQLNGIGQVLYSYLQNNYDKLLTDDSEKIFKEIDGYDILNERGAKEDDQEAAPDKQKKFYTAVVNVLNDVLYDCFDQVLLKPFLEDELSRSLALFFYDKVKDEVGKHAKKTIKKLKGNEIRDQAITRFEVRVNRLNESVGYFQTSLSEIIKLAKGKSEQDGIVKSIKNDFEKFCAHANKNWSNETKLNCFTKFLKYDIPVDGDSSKLLKLDEEKAQNLSKSIFDGNLGNINLFSAKKQREIFKLACENPDTYLKYVEVCEKIIKIKPVQVKKKDNEEEGENVEGKELKVRDEKSVGDVKNELIKVALDLYFKVAKVKTNDAEKIFSSFNNLISYAAENYKALGGKLDDKAKQQQQQEKDLNKVEDILKRVINNKSCEEILCKLCDWFKEGSRYLYYNMLYCLAHDERFGQMYDIVEGLKGKIENKDLKKGFKRCLKDLFKKKPKPTIEILSRCILLITGKKIEEDKKSYFEQLKETNFENVEFNQDVANKFLNDYEKNPFGRERKIDNIETADEKICEMYEIKNKSSLYYEIACLYSESIKYMQAVLTKDSKLKLVDESETKLLSEMTNEQLKDTVRVYFNALFDKAISPSEKWVLLLDVLAIFNEALFRTNGIYLRPVQMISVFTSMYAHVYNEKNLVLGIDTGEGKTYTSHALAFMQYVLTGKCFVITSNDVLAQESKNGASTIFDLFDIKTEAVKNKKDIIDSGIMFSSMTTLEHTFQSMELDGQKVETGSAILDECDAQLLDRTTAIKTANPIDADPKDSRQSNRRELYMLICKAIKELEKSGNEFAYKDVRAQVRKNYKSLPTNLQSIMDMMSSEELQELVAGYYSAKELKCGVHYTKHLGEDKRYTIVPLQSSIAVVGSTFVYPVQQMLACILQIEEDEKKDGAKTFIVPPHSNEQMLGSSETFINRFRQQNIIGMTGTPGDGLELINLMDSMGACAFKIPPNKESQRTKCDPIITNDQQGKLFELLLKDLPDGKLQQAIADDEKFNDDAYSKVEYKKEIAENKAEDDKRYSRVQFVFCKDASQAHEINNKLIDKMKEGNGKSALVLLLTGEEKSLDAKTKRVVELVKAADEQNKSVILITTEFGGRGVDFKNDNIRTISLDPANERSLIQGVGRGGRQGRKSEAHYIYDVKDYGEIIPADQRGNDITDKDIVDFYTDQLRLKRYKERSRKLEENKIISGPLEQFKNNYVRYIGIIKKYLPNSTKLEDIWSDFLEEFEKYCHETVKTNDVKDYQTELLKQASIYFEKFMILCRQQVLSKEQLEPQSNIKMQSELKNFRPSFVLTERYGSYSGVSLLQSDPFREDKAKLKNSLEKNKKEETDEELVNRMQGNSNAYKLPAGFYEINGIEQNADKAETFKSMWGLYYEYIKSGAPDKKPINKVDNKTPAMYVREEIENANNKSKITLDLRAGLNKFFAEKKSELSIEQVLYLQFRCNVLCNHDKFEFVSEFITKDNAVDIIKNALVGENIAYGDQDLSAVLLTKTKDKHYSLKYSQALLLMLVSDKNSNDASLKNGIEDKLKEFFVGQLGYLIGKLNRDARTSLQKMLDDKIKNKTLSESASYILHLYRKLASMNGKYEEYELLAQNALFEHGYGKAAINSYISYNVLANVKKYDTEKSDAIYEYSLDRAVQLSNNYRGYSVDILGSEYNKDADIYRAIVRLTHGNNKIYAVADISSKNDYCILHEVDDVARAEEINENDPTYRNVCKFIKDPKRAQKVYLAIKNNIDDGDVAFKQKFASQKYDGVKNINKQNANSIAAR